MLVCLAALQVAVSAAAPPPRPIRQLLHTRWGVQEGAPAEVRSLAQTLDGYLWLGTTHGVFRFDGMRFVPITFSRVRSGAGSQLLLATRDSSLWVVWGDGSVTRRRGREETRFGREEGLPPVLALAESGDGTVIAGTAKGLSKFERTQWLDAGAALGFPATASRSVWFDRDGGLWAQSEDRILHRSPGATQFVDAGIRLIRGAQQAHFAQTSDGTIWLAELSKSVRAIRSGSSSAITSEVMVRSLTLLSDRRGAFWIGTFTDGLRRFVNPRDILGRRIAESSRIPEAYTTKEGLLSDAVSAILEDQEGNIWVATPRGLERFRESAFTAASPSQSPRPTIVFPSRDSAVWVLTHNVDGFLRHGASGSDTIQTSFSPLGLFEDRHGNQWAVSDSGIHRRGAGGFERVPLRAPGRLQRFVDIVVDTAGVVWVYSDRLGLLRSRGDSLVSVAPVSDAAFPHANLFLDSRGRIWMSENSAVSLHANGTLRRFTEPRNYIGRVQAFFEDRNGDIWAAASGGLARYDGDGFRTLSARQQFPQRLTFGIAEDREGAWWVVTRNGVSRLPPGEAERAFADPEHILEYRTFDQLDGLPGMTYGGMYGPMATATPDGKIWVATDGGAASIDPRNLPRETPPPVLVEALRVDGKELPTQGEQSIPPNPREVEIDFTSTRLSTPERIRFRYRMENQDTAWHDVGSRRRAYYTGLAPGAYRFRVTASYGDGAWHETGALVAFRVPAAWYQTLWFRGGAFLLFGAAASLSGVAIQRRRHARIQLALKREYDATLTERARIAQDLHDTLLQGFAGVTLQLKTAELALPERPDVAVETIKRVQELARTSLREARERVWDMREIDLGDDDLSSALESLARERAAGTRIDLTFETTGERRRLPPHVEDAAFRIGREAVVNAVRHAEAHRITVHTTYEGTSLYLEVSDDGRGFTPGEAEEAHRRGHFGLTGARERAASVGGRCTVRPRPGGGTIVAVHLPLDRHRGDRAIPMGNRHGPASAED